MVAEHLHQQNNSPSWFTTYGSSGNNLDGQGVGVTDCGVVLEFNLAEVSIQHQFEINSLGGAGTGLSGA